MIKPIPSKKLLVIVLSCMSCCVFAQSKTSDFVLQDQAKLSAIKKQYQSGDAAISKEITALSAEADQDLTAGPFSVTLQKTRMAPSGDMHDYVSQAPYWWADSAKPDGKPYIRRDGERNPELKLLHDDSQMVKLCDVVKTLSSAYYFTGKEQYAQKAAELLKIWFVDPATRMNPNLNYAQYIPGINDGRGIGIIETRNLVAIPDAVAMLQGSKGLSDELTTGIKKWFIEYVEWLQTSKNGTSEHKELNNHGTNYDMQLVDFALFIGNTKLAHDVITKTSIPRFEKQFTLDGEQPLELARTKSWGYSSFNLEAWTRLSIMADKLGIDLWHTETKDGRGIKKCIVWMLPYLLKEKEWTYKQIEKMNYNEMLYICNVASAKYADVDFQKVFAMYPQAKLWMLY